MSNSPFRTFLEDIFTLEGGFTNNPRDNGGATKYGITQKTLAMWRKVDHVTIEEVQNLRIEEAEQIYKALYWDPIQGDALPVSIALLTFDAAINSGVSQASRWLQQAVGVMADGHIGNKTLSAISKYTEKDIIKKMVAARIKMLCKHEDFDVYGNGWIQRAIGQVIESILIGHENRSLGG